MGPLVLKLLAFLNRVWRKDPAQELAIRLVCDGQDLTWQIADGILTINPTGGTAAPLAIDLSAYTVGSLSLFLAEQHGYAVLYTDSDQVYELSALVLFDQAGDVNTTNGDHIYAFTNPNWSIFGAAAQELNAAQSQIVQMLLQMSIQIDPTQGASGEWLDLQGSYYAVPRIPGETDISYAARIIPTVLLPKGNNVAIANIVGKILGQPVRVVDVITYTPVEPMYDGTYRFDGSQHYNAVAHVIYGLFDITIGQDILGNGLPLPTALLRAIVETARDAGTQLRSITGTPSVLTDTAAMPTKDVATMTVTHQLLYNGARTFNGTLTYSGAQVVAETLLG